jgi:spermidine synthase
VLAAARAGVGVCTTADVDKSTKEAEGVCDDGRVKPWELLGETRTPDGETLTLMRQDREFIILASGKPLMSSRMHGSEEALASLGCGHLGRAHDPCVLVGGLGMGFTLAATLAHLPDPAAVVVAELVGGVVEWNRGPLGQLAAHPLKDRRVDVVVGDVLDTLAAGPARFDAVLLDVDNGPDAFTSARNAALYGDGGLAIIRAALRPGGVLAVWSAWEDRKFEQRLRAGGFEVDVQRVRARLGKGGPWHTIFLGAPSDRRPVRTRPAPVRAR